MQTLIPTFCEDASPVFFSLLDFSIAPPFLYYSYIPMIGVLMIFSIFVLISDKFSRNSILLAFLSFCLTAANFTTLLQWIAAPVSLVMFSWQLWNIAHVGIFLFAAYFTYSFINKRDLSWRFRVIFFLLYLPIILLTPTTLNIPAFDYANCEGILGPLFTYGYIIDLLCIVFVIVTTLKATAGSKREGSEKAKAALVGLATFSLLSLFLATTYLSDIIDDYRVEMFGSLGGLIFIATMTYLVVEYKIFSSKIIASQALIAALLALVGSLLFVAKSDSTRLVAGATLVFTAFTGLLLVKSVKREVRQREQLEVLTKKLEAANERLKELDKQKSEFVSIASHQLRSPLTAMRGYASMLAEGSYGTLSDKAHEVAVRIEESAKLMAVSVEDYLNVSRIESGNMKYNLSDFNIKEMTEHICDDIRPEAMKKGLILLFRSNINGKGIVNADVGKTNQIIHNLINNSLKYTERGSINVFVRDDVAKKRVYVDITDTGIGMSQETMNKLFHKFTRAENANAVNVSGTGLGLFVALKMAEAMGGTITCTSEGDGKGSTFTFELPAVM
jgi:signal transduction histidine kinase